MIDPTPIEVNPDDFTRGLHDAFDIVQHDPARRKANLTGLTGLRDLWREVESPHVDGGIDCLCFSARHICTRDVRQIQAMRRYVMALWDNNLTSTHATSLSSIVIRCFPDNVDDYLIVELEWVTPLLPVES